MEKDLDRHLNIPSEANRDKHINFLEEESGNGDSHPGNEGIAPTKEDENRRRAWPRD